MEIFHLRYFVAVAEKLSFTKAAQQLHMATSPLSRRIRDLEQDLGTVLFERDTHSVHLTRAGAALLPIAKSALSTFDDIPWRLQQAVGEERRTVSMGIAPGIHLSVRERLKQVQERGSREYAFKRWPGGSSDLLASVRRGRLDFAVVHLPVHAPGVRVLRVFEEPLGALLPADEFGERTSVSLGDLLDLTYVTVSPGCLPTYFEQISVRLAAAGINRRITLDSADYGSVREIIANGSSFALTMLDPGNPIRDLDVGECVVLPFSDFRPQLSTGLIWRQERAEAGGDLHGLVSHIQHVF
ncbi:LysR family transcriptional regulator [Streptomyces lichenis]|uniref:LysR family transcriptional regulator n=1 Tax=Streptomyces lichenis TaxID=2306967 RepID=A0ABT0IB11_9ACTN|nr:LysR family transcriptional regulator [Streptomyces lichenis]MCK8678490.1 LysR family transcriptional regulator [Streptomyces lichenis]